MTKKEQEPRRNEDERETHPKKTDYNPDITSEDQEVLNNQSQDEKRGDYFEDRETPIDYAGADLDIPEMDDKQFNPTTNKPDDSETEKRPKDSANTRNEDEDTETIYKGKEAENYRDPSKKEERGTSENRSTDQNAVGGDQSKTSERQQSRPENNENEDKERNKHPRRDGGVL